MALTPIMRDLRISLAALDISHQNWLSAHDAQIRITLKVKESVAEVNEHLTELLQVQPTNHSASDRVVIQRLDALHAAFLPT